MDPNLRFSLLGQVDIRLGDTPVTGFYSRKAQALLIYLAVTDLPLSRPALAGLLWADMPDADALVNLRQVLTNLRRLVGTHLDITRQTISFNPESPVWLDVAALQKGVAGASDQADLEQLGQAVALYRGDFLTGFFVRDAPLFEEWLLVQRASLRELALQTLHKLTGAYTQRGDYEHGLATARRLLELEPWYEESHRQVMFLLARSGQRSAALAQYRTCRQLLTEEVGVEPEAETIALAEAIQQGQVQARFFSFPNSVWEREKSREAWEREKSREAWEREKSREAWEREKSREAWEREKSAPKRPVRPRFPTTLVGRADQMATLRPLWQQVAAGTSQLVLVTGEPGIGKTRLIEELLAEVTEPALVLRVKCPELPDPLAYSLFVDPLRQALAGARPPDLSDTWLVEVSRLLPELRDGYPNLPEPTRLDPSTERRRLFDAICATLLTFTRQHPLLLFLDDVQWADPTSLALLNYLNGWLDQAAVLIIAAYRSHEVPVRPNLSQIFSTWQRANRLTQLALAPLSQGEVTELLRELSPGSGTHPAFGSLIYRETQGNPLFVVETIAMLRAERRLPQTAADQLHDFRLDSVTIPSQVQTIIQARLACLDTLSREVVRAAAVIQAEFEAELVQKICGRSELETLDGLDDLLARGLLVERAADRFSFSHDKIREVVYDSLSRSRRKLLHRRVAETLETQAQSQTQLVAEYVAHHYERAGLPDKSLAYRIQAGHGAMEQYAYEAAIAHYQKALSLLKKQQAVEPAARILMRLGLLYHNILDFQQARQAYEEGFALWQAAGQSDTGPDLPPAPHALRVDWRDPLTLDPARSGNFWSAGVIGQLFSGLVELSPHMEILPDMAQTWEVLDNGRKYIFHLRDEVYWSDGVPLTAADFEYAWKRVLATPGMSLAGLLLHDIKCARAFQQGQICEARQVGVYTVDEQTLAVELEEPTAYFLHVLAHPATYPVPRHRVKALGEAWTAPQHLVTNGPFQLDDWQPGQVMRFSRNPHYQGRFSGNLQQVELHLRTDPVAKLTLYEADGLDAFRVWFLPPAAMNRARQQHAGEYLSGPQLTTLYIGFDTTRPPFDDQRVRRAFVLATDRERHAEIVRSGQHALASGGFVPKGMPGYSAEVGWPYNPEQACRLLAEAGYPNAQGFPIVTFLASNFRAEESQQVADHWRKNLGVEIHCLTTQEEITGQVLAELQPHIFLNGWAADYPDPDSFLRLCLQTTQPDWHNKTFERLIGKARQAAAQEKRISLYRQADKILMEEAALMPLTYAQVHLLVKPWVRRYPISLMRGWFWKEVILEPH